MATELLPGYYRGDDGAWLTLPWPSDYRELPPSLGPQVIEWCENWLVHHITGEPWQFTRGQRRFIHMWYALTPAGRWLYTSGVKRGAKGTGKDPTLSALAAAEAWGPVHFSHWEGDIPVGKPHRLALVQIGANSEDQGKDVLRVMNAMLSDEMKKEYLIYTGITRTIDAHGNAVETMAASERSSEGDPITAGFLNETHHMVESSGGHKVANVIRRNATKSPVYVGARVLEFTNAHMQGAESVAELSFDSWQSQVMGKTHRKSLLYDSIEADPDTDMSNPESLMRGIAQAYRDSPWTDLDRIADAIQDTRTPVSDSIRYYLNGLGAAEDSWIDPRKFDLLRAERAVAKGERITMFLDCSKSWDATALVGCTYSDGHVFTLGVWERPKGMRGEWKIPREDVDMVVLETFENYEVVWFGVDPSSAEDEEADSPDQLYWTPYIDKWHQMFRKKLKVWASPGVTRGSSVVFDLRTSTFGSKYRNDLFTQAAMLTAREIDVEGSLTHDGNLILRRHVHQARRRPNNWGISLSKATRSSKKHIDAATGMVGARMGRRIVMNSGKLKPKTGRISA